MKCGVITENVDKLPLCSKAKDAERELRMSQQTCYPGRRNKEQKLLGNPEEVGK